MAQRPSLLGLSLTAALLLGLLAWRYAVPRATPWLDLLVLVAAAALLLAVRAYLDRR